MYGYDKLIVSNVSVNFTRMLIGASSTIYMVVSGLNLYQIGLIKSFQAAIIVLLGLLIGVVSDRMNRKILYITGVFLACIWLLTTYIAGIKGSFNLFLISEFFNALSLCIFQNNNYAYLVDSYNKQFNDNDIKKLFGKLSYLDFLFMAIASLLGGFAYTFINKELFLLSSFIMFLILIISFLYLPDCKISPHEPSQENTNFSKLINKDDFILILEKFKFYKKSVLLFILLNLYFQIIIQYWQVLVYQFNIVKKNEFLLGIILFCMLLIQSWSGKVVQKHEYAKNQSILVLFSMGLVLSLLGLKVGNLLGLCCLMIGICSNLFSIRYVIVDTNAKIHANIPDFVRAKYDTILNTSLRLLTALGLLGIGFVSQKTDINSIVYVGFLIGGSCLIINSCIKDA